MTYDDVNEAELLDLNNSGTPDVSLNVTYEYDTDGVTITDIHYFAHRLAGCDAFGEYSYFFDETTDKYCSITFVTTFAGDVNLDGIVDICDVTAIQRHLADLELLSGQALTLADIDGNGVIEITDVTCLQMYLAGYETALANHNT